MREIGSLFILFKTVFFDALSLQILGKGFHDQLYAMPGVNCAVWGCGSCRRTKGLGIFKLPAAKDEVHKKWREGWLGEITKTREKNFEFQKLIENDTVYTCEKHFKPDEIEICKQQFTYKKQLNV